MDKPNHIGAPNRSYEMGRNKYLRLKDRLQNIEIKSIHKKIARIGLIILLIFALGAAAYRSYLVSIEAFDVFIGDAKIGTVREKELALTSLEDIKMELSKEYNMDIVFTKDLVFREVHAKDDLITSLGDLKGDLKSKIGFMVYGYILKVDGEEVAAVKTEEEMESVIEMIKEPYITGAENEILKDISIVEEIEIERKEIAFNKIQEVDQVYNFLLTSGEEIKTHRVEVGESLWTIAAFYNMEVEDLIEANPDKNPDALQIGDEIELIVPKPVLTVETLSQVEYEKKIDYERKVEYDDSKYNTYEKLEVPGKEGLENILEAKTRHNGVLIDQEIVNRETLVEPIAEVLLKGTIEPPKTMATGSFSRPTRGRLSSPYGMRNGRMHRGIDIANGMGTSIKAADGGKVVYVGYRGAYGKLVEIDHENGYKTRYAHNSQFLVKQGERVYKGQEIAKMGSTGRSTGSHLHFEIVKSGSTQNPSKYVD